MFRVFSTLSFGIVLILLCAEVFCDEDLVGPLLTVENSHYNNSSSIESRPHNPEWPALNRNQHQLSSGVNRGNGDVTSRFGNQNWPAVGENPHLRHNNNHANSQDQSSFVQSQIQRWNSQLNRNNSYASTLTRENSYLNVRPNINPTSGPYTGYQFGSHNGNDRNTPEVAEKKGTPSQVTDEELREFSEKLLSKDDNNAAKYVQINFQGRTTSRSKIDEAPQPLLYINKEAYNIPTIAKLQPLYDNYIVEADVNEDYTNHEKQEENALMRAIMETDVMKATRNFLMELGAITRSERDFQNLLQEIWFNHYSRGKRKLGSSAFEHVFLAEIKKGDVSGLHNWLYFEKEESNRRANYLGYLKKIDLGNKGAILKFNFDYHGINKPVGSMFIGTSPEFEMALYSVCFILRADRICPLKLNGHRFIIRTYSFRYDGKNLIGSAFPEI